MKRIFLIVTGIIAISCLESSPVPDSDTRKLLLDLHNEERQDIGLEELTWSSDLSEAAQKWANYLASTKQFYHSGTSGVGENIAKSSSKSASSLFKQWSSQKEYFDPTERYGSSSSTDSSKEVSHYTQIIWSMTFEVGCGLADGPYMSVLVCQYKYAGNFDGNWVYKPSSSDPWKVAGSVVKASSLKSPPEPDTYPSKLDDSIIDQLLDLHNTEREFVGMKSMSWSSRLASIAQEHANEQAKAGTFKRSGSGYGENMQSATIRPDIVRYMFNLWANEKVNFDATLPYPDCAIDDKMISHYTQIVWSKSRDLGCGLATNSRNSILVCLYDLGGNYQGNYAVYPAPSENFQFSKND